MPTRKVKRGGDAPADDWFSISKNGGGVVEITLGGDVSIKTDAACIVSIDDGVAVTKEPAVASVLGALLQTVGLSRPTSPVTIGTDVGKVRVVLASPFPGDVVAVHLAQDQSYKIARGSFLASTGDVELLPGSTMSSDNFAYAGEEKLMDIVRARTPNNTVFLVSPGPIAVHSLGEQRRQVVVNLDSLLMAPAKAGWEAHPDLGPRFGLVRWEPERPAFDVLTRARTLRRHIESLQAAPPAFQVGGRKARAPTAKRPSKARASR